MIYTNALSSGGGEASNYLDRNGVLITEFEFPNMA